MQAQPANPDRRELLKGAGLVGAAAVSAWEHGMARHVHLHDKESAVANDAGQGELTARKPKG